MDDLRKSWDDKASRIFVYKGAEVANKVKSPYDGIIRTDFHAGLIKNIRMTNARDEAWAGYLNEVGAKRRRLRLPLRVSFTGIISYWNHIPRPPRLLRLWHGLFGELVLIDPMDWGYYIAVKRDLAARILTLGLP
jgi:hypothetical protein